MLFNFFYIFKFVKKVFPFFLQSVTHCLPGLFAIQKTTAGWREKIKKE